MLSVTREVPLAAEDVWSILVDTQAWPQWGPSVAAAKSPSRFIGPNCRGWVQLVWGPWLPFRITHFDASTHQWSWRVLGIKATSHRVRALGPEQCEVTFGVPLWAAPYLWVCRLALERIPEVAKQRSTKTT